MRSLNKIGARFETQLLITAACAIVSSISNVSLLKYHKQDRRKVTNINDTCLRIQTNRATAKRIYSRGGEPIN